MRVSSFGHFGEGFVHQALLVVDGDVALENFAGDGGAEFRGVGVDFGKGLLLGSVDFAEGAILQCGCFGFGLLARMRVGNFLGIGLGLSKLLASLPLHFGHLGFEFSRSAFGIGLGCFGRLRWNRGSPARGS